MAKEKVEEVTGAKDVTGLTINDGIRFGFGFMLVNLIGFAAVGLVAWLIILVTRFAGLTF